MYRYKFRCRKSWHCFKKLPNDHYFSLFLFKFVNHELPIKIQSNCSTLEIIVISERLGINSILARFCIFHWNRTRRSKQSRHPTLEQTFNRWADDEVGLVLMTQDWVKLRWQDLTFVSSYTGIMYFYAL